MVRTANREVDLRMSSLKDGNYLFNNGIFNKEEYGWPRAQTNTNDANAQGVCHP